MSVATLTTIDLSSLELLEVWSKSEPSERSRFNFPISGETGATGASVAYAQIEPGGGIPMHHDSANEVDVILEGELEFDVDGESRSVGPGVLIQIPSGGQTPRPQRRGSTCPPRLLLRQPARRGGLR
jgi:uncharacterized cupin superfamily protein